MKTLRHYMSLPLAQPGQVPDWVHLVPSGLFGGVDGRGPWIVKNAATVIAASMKDGKLVLDENHSTDLAAPEGLPSPARGWIVELQQRADGIWGRVEWNDSGKQLVIDGAYRGISPVFTRDEKTGEVNQLLRVALTNTPNIADLHSLHSKQEDLMNLAQMRAALGLPDGADEAAILNAATTARAAQLALPQHIAAIAAATGAKATEPAALITELQAARQSAGSVERMAAQITTMEAELNTLRTSRARDQAVAFVDGAIKAGKPVNALRDHYIERHMADAAAVEKEIGALVSLNSGTGFPPKNPAAVRNSDDDEEPTEMEASTAKAMGVDPKQLAKQRRQREANAAKGVC
jgi:phage I-like protein